MPLWLKIFQAWPWPIHGVDACILLQTIGLPQVTNEVESPQYERQNGYTNIRCHSLSTSDGWTWLWSLTPSNNDHKSRHHLPPNEIIERHHPRALNRSIVARICPGIRALTSYVVFLRNHPRSIRNRRECLARHTANDPSLQDSRKLIAFLQILVKVALATKTSCTLKARPPCVIISGNLNKIPFHACSVESHEYEIGPIALDHTVFSSTNTGLSQLSKHGEVQLSIPTSTTALLTSSQEIVWLMP